MRSLACSSAPWHRPPISPTLGAPRCRALRSALLDGRRPVSGLLLAALAGSWYLGAPGAAPSRIIHLVAALAWLPVIYALQLGQPGLLVALGVAGSYALMRNHRQFLSGLALGVIVLKPQLGFLLPFALLASGRYRAVAGAAVGSGPLLFAAAGKSRP